VVLIRIVGDPGSLARGPFAGLALAMSIATAIESGLLWLILRRRIGGIDGSRVWALTWRALLAAGVMGLAVWGALQVMASLPALFPLAAAGVVGVIAYFGLAMAFGLTEALAVPRMVLRRLGR
jgi:putative peptidoglycan lipid II flippase